MRDYVMDGTRYAKFCIDRFRGSAPQIPDFAVLLGWLVFSSFFGFFNKATAYEPKWIFTQSTLEHVVPGKEVPFGGLDNYIWYLYDP